MRGLILAAVLVCGTAFGQNTPKDDLAKHVKDIQSNKDYKARLKAVESLSAMEDGEGEVSRPLCNALADPSPKVAAAALAGLEKVRPDLYKPVVQMTIDSSGLKRMKAVQELAAMGAKAKPVLDLMVYRYGVEKGNAEFAGEIFKAVRMISTDDPAVVQFYKTLAGPGVKLPAARLVPLGYLVEWAGDDEARRKEVYPFIKAGIAEPAMQVACIRYAGDYGPLSKELLPAFKKLKFSTSSGVRDAAAAAIEKLEKP